MDFVSSIPGYREALDHEALIRAAAFLPVSETVAGFELRPMTLQDFMILRATKNPILQQELPKPYELAAFLWLLSIEPNRSNRSRRLFIRSRCRRFFPPPQPRLRLPWLMRIWNIRVKWASLVFAKVTHAAFQYIEETLMDWPTTRHADIFNCPNYSEGIGVIASLARVYHWSESDILSLPMKRLLGYFKEMSESDGIISCNPSDRFRIEALNKPPPCD